MALEELTLKIDGAPFPDSEMDDLVELTVDTDLFLPAMASFTLQDKVTDGSSYSYIDNATRFKIGAMLEISLGALQHDERIASQGVLFKGEVTSIEPTYASSGNAQLCIRGYDRSHRLMRVKRYRSFASVNLADIVQKIATESGLSAKVDSSGLSNWQFESFLQYNQTDWEFLWAQAHLVGYQVYVNDRSLCFEKINAERNRRPNFSLSWGQDLTSFEPRASVMGLMSKSSTYGWDPATKKAISSTVSSAPDSTAPTLSGMGADGKGSAAVRKAFGENADFVSSQPVLKTGQASDLAEAALSASESDYVRANGFCAEGHPFILAGTKVQIKNLGTRFSGTYHITKAVHQVRTGRYTVSFCVSGSGPNTLLHLLNPERLPDPSRINGMVTAVVTNAADPKKLGRVKVKYPWLPMQNGAELESGWVRTTSAAGGADRGFYFVPEVNDEVLVAFEHGDPNFPYIVGALWNDKDKPPAGIGEVIKGGKVNQRILRSRSGHLILLNDEDGREQILIQDSSGKNSITFDTAKKSITIKAEKDLTIEAGGNITLDAGGDFVVKSKKKATVEAMDAITLDSKKEIALKVPANTFGLKASGAEISAMKIDIKANTMLSLNGNAMVELKGGLVKIN